MTIKSAVKRLTEKLLKSQVCPKTIIAEYTSLNASNDISSSFEELLHIIQVF